MWQKKVKRNKQKSNEEEIKLKQDNYNKSFYRAIKPGGLKFTLLSKFLS
jgi:hypothetical protein